MLPYHPDMESLKRILFHKVNKVIEDLTVCAGETYLFTRYPLIEVAHDMYFLILKLE